MSRYHSSDTVVVGDTLNIRFYIENGESYPLYGFFLSDQIPTGFRGLWSDIKLDGDDLHGYYLEVGYDGELYGGSTPNRWVFETPPDFRQTAHISPGGVAEIEYTLRCPETGIYFFQNFNWAGGVVNESDTLWVFGYDDDSLKIVVANINRPPRLNPIGEKVLDVGDTLNFIVIASDPDSDPLALNASPLPPNASFIDNEDGTGDFLFIPDSTQADSYEVLFVVSDGALSDSELVTITVTEVGLEDSLDKMGSRDSFLDVYPNPFAKIATVAYALPTEAIVSIQVYNSSGRLMRRLCQGKQSPGHHRIKLVMKSLPTGVYLLHLETNQYATTRKIILIK